MRGWLPAGCTSFNSGGWQPAQAPKSVNSLTTDKLLQSFFLQLPRVLTLTSIWSLKEVLDRLQCKTFFTSFPAEALVHKSLFLMALHSVRWLNEIHSMSHHKNLFNFHQDLDWLSIQPNPNFFLNEVAKVFNKDIIISNWKKDNIRNSFCPQATILKLISFLLSYS